MRIFVMIAVLVSMSCLACTLPASIPEIEPVSVQDKKPKLVVGIVVDQMRYDFLTRFADQYGETGFKRMMNEGFSAQDHHYSYSPTFTGPGHASIYTGTTPAHHGIISNGWYDIKTDTSTYCAGDETVTGVGSDNSLAQMSPRKMLTTTMCDELKLFSNQRSKTIGVSIKDRGAILPAGHSADGAYWFIGGTEGNWITSSYYRETLPSWVDKFNSARKVDEYLSTPWTLLRPESDYAASLPDNNPYEGAFTGGIRPTFPYQLDSLAAENGNYDILKAVAWGNSLTLDFAKAAIEGEDLGDDSHCDFMALSFSTTDYIGHKFGPQSREAHDAYLRLDIELGEFFNYLDQEVGEGEYVVFLTADHGAVQVPSHLESLKIPSGYWNPGNMVDDVKVMLNTRFGEGDWVDSYSNDQFFLNRELIAEKGIDGTAMQRSIANFVLGYDGVHQAYTRSDLLLPSTTEGLAALIKNGYHPKRSGDVAVIIEPGWLQYSTRTGSSHGSAHAYDTHVPFLIYGPGVNQGSSHTRTYIKDIAPTVCALLGIQMPNGNSGSVMTEIID
jgi:predicted AlkP superfamily pyrophosphatase or phosphodiesterase